MLVRTFFYFGLWLLLVIPSVGLSQFSRYWNESFSTKAALLSGAVIGGYSDETSIYYNPSILSDSSENSLSFSNGLAKMDLVRYENAMGEGLDVENWESSVASGFISVGIYPKDDFGLVWKVAVFNKSKFDNSFKGEFRANEDVFLQAPGDEIYLGRISSRTEYNDYWYGLGLAKRSNSKISIGTSFFLRYSGLRYSAIKSIEVAPFDSSSFFTGVSSNNFSNELRGYVWRGTFKIGINYKLNDKVKFGVVITTPSVALMGSADITSSVTYVNVVSKYTQGYLPDLISDQTTEGADFNIKDPLSVALGIDYRQKRYRLNMTLEWFSSLEPYRMLDSRVGETVTTISQNAEVGEGFQSFAAGGNSIVNFAIGLEKYTNTNRSWLFGFKTDFDALRKFNYKELSDLNTLVNAKADYYHFSAGKNFRFMKYEILFGLEYSLAREQGLNEFANFTPPIEVDDLNPYNMEGKRGSEMHFKGDALVIFLGLTLKN